MNLQVFRLIYKHGKLAEKRSAAFEQNKSARYVLVGFGIFMVFYMIFISVMLALIANESKRLTGIGLIGGILPFILVFDFLRRFAMQQTPSQQVKPYLLLPIPRHTCIDCYLTTSMLSPSNLIWHTLYLPYALMAILPRESMWVTLVFLLGLWLIEVINSQWYLLVRSLVNISYRWWILPFIVYGAIAWPFYMGAKAGIDKFFHFYSKHLLTPWAAIGIPALLILLFFLNRHVQYRATWKETTGEDPQTQKSAFNAKLSFLDSLGEIGEYLRLELRTIARCKNIRKTVMSGMILVVIFALLLSFTSIYDSPFFISFWLIYCYAILGAMLLIKVMCYEGNYIDGLMVHHNNIYRLLQAKFVLYGLSLIINFLLLTPTLFTGKCTLFSLIAYGLFTAGPVHILLLQMAVYNKQTIPLNTKFVGKGTMENNWLQVVVELFVFFFPIFIIRFLHLFFADTTVYAIMSLTGIAFIVTHPMWLRSIYRRMMLRRYANMEGLRASRG